MVNPPDTPRFDTRGLPEGYDPHKFYEYSVEKHAKDATGLEYLLYKYIPHSIIKSFAIAIDPLSQVKTSLGVVTPANRTRVRAMNSLLINQHVLVKKQQINTSRASLVNYENIPGKDGPMGETVQATGEHTDDSNYWQPVLEQYSRDTSRKTRLMGSTVGEFEKFNGYVNTSPRYVSSIHTMHNIFDQNVSPTNPYCAQQEGREASYRNVTPYGAVLGTDSYLQLKLHEKDVALALMQKHVLSMFTGANPQSRNYSLFRNIVELRDIPHSILSLKETLSNLHKLHTSFGESTRVSRLINNFQTSLSDIPKQYLSYHFGWKQTYKDVMDLLSSPAKISKQINLLIERSGKPTTYRSKRIIATAEDDISGFAYIDTDLDIDRTIRSRVERSTELRLVLNTTFQFPTVDRPAFVEHMFNDKLGIYPRAIDLYNLVPWTWLVDWFTGLSNYLEVIENIQRDKSIINWGFLTASTSGKLVTDYKSKSVDTHDEYYNYHGGDPHTTQVSIRNNFHSSIYNYNFQLRKDLATIMDVHSTSDPSTLTAYQNSILGAILAQRLDFSRPFRIPR